MHIKDCLTPVTLHDHLPPSLPPSTQSDPSKALSFVSKLSDFGLAKLLRENYYIVNRSGSGTVTHLAPELFQVGARCASRGVCLCVFAQVSVCCRKWGRVCASAGVFAQMGACLRVSGPVCASRCMVARVGVCLCGWGRVCARGCVFVRVGACLCK